MKVSVETIVTVLIAVVSASLSIGVMTSQVSGLTESVSEINGRLKKIEQSDDSIELRKLRWEFTRNRCEMQNIQRVLDSQPKKDCD